MLDLLIKIICLVIARYCRFNALNVSFQSHRQQLRIHRQSSLRGNLRFGAPKASFFCESICVVMNYQRSGFSVCHLLAVLPLTLPKERRYGLQKSKSVF